MARKLGKERSDQDEQLRESAISLVQDLWGKTAGRFYDALDDSGERKTIQLVFKVELNLKNSAPVVDVEISFKDKCKENGMTVMKTYRMGTADELDDPTQPMLPGADPKKSGRKKKDKDEANPVAE